MNDHNPFGTPMETYESMLDENRKLLIGHPGKPPVIPTMIPHAEPFPLEPEDSNFKSGAVRSADANHLEFTSLPWLGIIGIARTAGEGAAKYGRLNYAQGMPVHDLLNHALRHISMFLLGDRSEPHLEHGSWNMLAAIQSLALDPELSLPHLLGPGATITPELQKKLDDERPILKARRDSGELKDAGEWVITNLPEVVRLLEQRRVTSPAN